MSDNVNPPRTQCRGPPEKSQARREKSRPRWLQHRKRPPVKSGEKQRNQYIRLNAEKQVI